MSQIRGRDTSPEVRLRKALWALGLRYRLSSRLPGKPDLVFRRHKTALFVDGCFWHQCPAHSPAPKTNEEFWRRKLEANVVRDRRVEQELSRLGWRVIRVWEHDVNESVERTAIEICPRIRGATSE